eukprot:CAMPEP_0206311858 /NCGR_PEP_ID=MMETSP0106_2-20121207/13685_1 /ASSEMBLY_ACC=CAM_ASM_000206 /TAXON_ID=81532 /ORGANISM="Acanthoeca-like sp., Strain 10tr" /LENGTH=339 /DNA_ID=CAMNT_0053743129 /DNA_START=59 /DNA_END=1078 /DNA_ORIENTATION=-
MVQGADFYISYNPVDSDAVGLVAKLQDSLQVGGKLVQLGAETWPQAGGDVGPGQDGVQKAKCVVAVVSGGGDSPYLGTAPCVSELRRALQAGVMVQPVIRAADKTNIASFLTAAPGDLQSLGEIDFISLDQSDEDYWGVGVRKILVASGVLAKSPVAQQPRLAAALQPAPAVAACTFCQLPAVLRCSNCGSPCCSVHQTFKWRVLDQTAAPTHDAQARLCSTCADLNQLLSDEAVRVQSCGNLLLACFCGVCLMAKGVNVFRDWIPRVERAFREYNAKVSPPVPIRVQQGLFDYTIYPHAHPYYEVQMRVDEGAGAVAGGGTAGGERIPLLASPSAPPQ